MSALQLQNLATLAAAAAAAQNSASPSTANPLSSSAASLGALASPGNAAAARLGRAAQRRPPRSAVTICHFTTLARRPNHQLHPSPSLRSSSVVCVHLTLTRTPCRCHWPPGVLSFSILWRGVTPSYRRCRCVCMSVCLNVCQVQVFPPPCCVSRCLSGSCSPTDGVRVDNIRLLHVGLNAPGCLGLNTTIFRFPSSSVSPCCPHLLLLPSFWQASCFCSITPPSHVGSASLQQHPLSRAWIWKTSLLLLFLPQPPLFLLLNAHAAPNARSCLVSPPPRLAASLHTFRLFPSGAKCHSNLEYYTLRLRCSLWMSAAAILHVSMKLKTSL